MAVTSVPITAGIGTPIAIDQSGGLDYQLVKLASGAAGAAALVEAVAPLPVVGGIRSTEQYTRLALSFAANGDNAILAAVAAQFVRVFGIMLIADSPVSVKLGETGPTYWTGAMKFGTAGGIILMPQGEPIFMTSAVNKGFLINLSAAVQCSGVLWYRQEA